MTRIKREKLVVGQMVRLYCRHHHAPTTGGTLCPECAALLQYAHARLSRCRFGEEKTTCKRCPIHCYRPDMKQRISQVMRWAGPRMLLYHPLAALRHLWR